MKALVVHALFDVLGGGELLALRASQALQEAGFDVKILTATPVDPPVLSRVYGGVKLPEVIVKRVKTAEYASRLMPGRLVRLRRLLVYRQYMPLIEELRNEYDLVIDTQSNLPTPADLVYIHFPAILELHVERHGLQWRVYGLLVKHLARPFKAPRAGRVLTNSTWTAHMVYKAYGVVPDVVYPPVDVEFFNLYASSDKREKLVVTISRFTPEKGLEKLVEAAKVLPDYKFVFVGTVGAGSERVLGNIEEEARRSGLSNVEVRPNLPRTEVARLLGEASFYLHPPFPEHFGISIVEAMAAGAVPLVYRDGGGWYDVVSRVSSELGYCDVREVPGIIRRLEADRGLYEELRRRSVEVSKLFGYDNFKKSFLEKVSYVLRVKKLGQQREEPNKCST
ncbi:MAG: glycosyltransferase family 4 protein [Desulfurococcaceae archaeon]